MYNPFTGHPRFNHHGATLVGLMIGMLISIVSVLAILALYKNLITVSIDATEDAAHDGQVATALITAQLEVQAAGYGIVNADGLHLNTNEEGSEIRWRYYDNGQYQCRAIREVVIDDRARSLMLYEGQNLCDATTALGDVEWQPLSTLTKIVRQQAIDEAIFTFSVSTAECAPFGIGKTGKHLMATMSAVGSADFHNSTSDITATGYKQCIVSTHPS
ncbi:MAG TPA: hypothetical protein VIC26_09095 [Marinagarivorans sp.]